MTNIANFRFTLGGRASGAAPVVVEPDPEAAPPARVVVTPETATVRLGTERRLTAVVYDAADVVIPGASVVWSSSDPYRVSVSSSGVVRANHATVTMGAGDRVIITATAGSASDSAGISVPRYVGPG